MASPSRVGALRGVRQSVPEAGQAGDADHASVIVDSRMARLVESRENGIHAENQTGGCDQQPQQARCSNLQNEERARGKGTILPSDGGTRLTIYTDGERFQYQRHRLIRCGRRVLRIRSRSGGLDCQRGGDGGQFVNVNGSGYVLEGQSGKSYTGPRGDLKAVRLHLRRCLLFRNGSAPIPSLGNWVKEEWASFTVPTTPVWTDQLRSK